MIGDSIGGPIRWRMHFPVPIAKVYRALDSDEGRAAFWAESAVERNDSIEFCFANGVTCSSRVLLRRPPELFVLDYMGGEARFELSQDGSGGTDLLLVHHGVAAAEWQEVHAGWLNVLFPLKAYVVYGVDLRNHDPSRSWDQGFADQ